MMARYPNQQVEELAGYCKPVRQLRAADLKLLNRTRAN